MCHELVVDEAHDTAAEEDSWTLRPQQHFSYKGLIPMGCTQLGLWNCDALHARLCGHCMCRAAGQDR